MIFSGSCSPMCVSSPGPRKNVLHGQISPMSPGCHGNNVSNTDFPICFIYILIIYEMSFVRMEDLTIEALIRQLENLRISTGVKRKRAAEGNLPPPKRIKLTHENREE